MPYLTIMLILNWLKQRCLPSNWSKLSDESSSNTRQNILFSQLCILAAIFTVIQSIDDFIELNSIMMSIDTFVFALVIFCHRYNEKGYHLVSKSVLLGFLNLLFFFLAAVIDPISKMELLYYPLIILTFMTLGREGLKLGFFFTTISFLSLIVLELTDHHPFGKIELQVGTQTQAITNIFTACFFLGLSAIFFVRISTKTESSLRSKKDELSKANTELDRFVYSASHDMRAPLLSIQGLVNIALMENKLEEMPKYLQMIKERALKLDEFIVEVTNYSRNSRLEVEMKPVDLCEIVDEAIEKVKYLDSLQGIAITKKILGDPIAHSDKGRLSILLNNLLSNSIKYHDRNKESRFINIEIQNMFDQFKISVRDNGTGIKQEHLGKIFDMFYRGTETSQGSGLGLYIVKELVEKMNGQISVKSEFGMGSEFEVVFSKAERETLMRVA
jgi:signal transduction histidine kinase